LTRIIDGAGRSVLPGFIEAHMQVFGGGAILIGFGRNMLGWTKSRIVDRVAAPVNRFVPTSSVGRTF
jgi:predicted amidohydrolase YtcJ